MFGPALGPTTRLKRNERKKWALQHQVDYSVKFVFFTLSGLKVKMGGCRVKFVKVYE